MIPAEETEPLEGLVIQVGLVRDCADAEILERDGLDTTGGAVQLEEFGIPFGAHVVHGRAVGEGEFRGGKDTEREVPGRRRTRSSPQGHNLQASANWRAAKKSALLRHESPTRAGISKPAVHTEPLLVGEQRDTPIRAGTVVRIRQLRRQERASLSQRGKPKILLEVLPAVHPIHLDTENLKLIAYAVFVPRIAHGGKPRGTKGGRKAADGREFRSILHAARITEEEFDFRLRKQRQVVILPGITR